jgi:hypothetical protein
MKSGVGLAEASTKALEENEFSSLIESSLSEPR